MHYMNNICIYNTNGQRINVYYYYTFDSPYSFTLERLIQLNP